jgi:hypothetical protein
VLTVLQNRKNLSAPAMGKNFDSAFTSATLISSITNKNLMNERGKTNTETKLTSYSVKFKGTVPRKSVRVFELGW